MCKSETAAWCERYDRAEAAAAGGGGAHQCPDRTTARRGRGHVRTHLERIYARLHVSSRTAAVLRAFPDRVGYAGSLQKVAPMILSGNQHRRYVSARSDCNDLVSSPPSHVYRKSPGAVGRGEYGFSQETERAEETGRPRKRSRLIPLGVVLGLGAAAIGGFAIAGSYDSHTSLTMNLAETSASTHHPGVTYYACRAKGKFTHVSVNKAPKCPAHSVLVHWTGHSGPTSSAKPQPQPTHMSDPPVSSAPASPTNAPSTTTPTSPANSPSSAAPSTSSAAPSSPPASGTGAQCVTSAARGQCGPYTYSGITGSSGSNTFVLNNMWAAKSGTTQTLTATSPGNWSVLANVSPPGSDRGPDLPGHAGDLHPGE